MAGTPKKSQRNAESLPFIRENVLAAFPKKYWLVPSQKNLYLLAFTLHSHKPMARKKRNITGLRSQPKLTPSHIKSTDDVPPIANSDLPLSSDADPDTDEEEWCPNLQFDSGKPKWDASDTEDDIDSEDKQDFLDSKEEQQPGVNIRRYRNKGLYIAWDS